MAHNNKRRARLQRRANIRQQCAEFHRVLIAAGLRSCIPLIEVLAEFAEISDRLPYASQETLAERCGVSARTIRRWLKECEQLGLVKVYRSPAQHKGDGTWKRKTNRYLLCTKVASGRRRQERVVPAWRPSGAEITPEEAETTWRTQMSSDLERSRTNGGGVETPAPPASAVNDGFVEPEPVLCSTKADPRLVSTQIQRARALLAIHREETR